MTRAEVLKVMRGPKYPLSIRLNQFIYDAHMLGLTYIIIKDNIITPKLEEELIKAGYSVTKEYNNVIIKW